MERVRRAALPAFAIDGRGDPSERFVTVGDVSVQPHALVAVAGHPEGSLLVLSCGGELLARDVSRSEVIAALHAHHQYRMDRESAREAAADAAMRESGWERDPHLGWVPKVETLPDPPGLVDDDDD